MKTIAVLSFVVVLVIVDAGQQDFWTIIPHPVTKRIGTFENCGTSTFEAYYEPEPMVMNERVYIKGNYTFTEDFTAGVVKMTVYSLPVKRLNITCSDYFDDCTNGNTATLDMSVVVPEIPFNLVDAELVVTIENAIGKEILCGKAVVNVNSQ